MHERMRTVNASLSSRLRLTVRLALVSGLVLVLAMSVGCGADDPALDEATDPVTAEPVAPDTEAPEEAPSAGSDVPEGATHTVESILAVPTEDERVVLSGEVTEVLGDDDFMFSDGTGEIYVDGDDDFGAMSVGDMLFVTGLVDVEDSPLRIEIDATGVQRR